MIQSKHLLFLSYAFLFLIIFCLSLVNISIGPGDLSFTKILNHLFLGQKLDSISAGMAFDLRLPRAMLATLVGASLGIAGVIHWPAPTLWAFLQEHRCLLLLV